MNKFYLLSFFLVFCNPVLSVKYRLRENASGLKCLNGDKLLALISIRFPGISFMRGDTVQINNFRKEVKFDGTRWKVIGKNR